MGNGRNTEPLKLCPNERCRRVLLPADEKAGKCPLCGWLLLTLAPRPAGLSPARAFEMAFVERE